jgi:hypothetical protein
MSDRTVKLDPGDFFDQLQLRQEYQLQQIRAHFTKGGLPVNAAEAIPLSVAAAGATPVVVDGARNPLQSAAGRLVGYALVEATGAASAEIDFYDGRTINGGALFLPVALNAGESCRDWFGPAGIAFEHGLWAQIVSGSVRGTVFIGRVDL